MMTMKRQVAAALFLTLFAAPVAAQQPPSTAKKPAAAAKRAPGRGFIAITAGLQAAPSDFTDEFTFTANAEAGTIEARYPSEPPFLLDASAGYRFWGRVGVALGVARTSSNGTVGVRASVPHPLLLDHDRLVEGEASDVSRTETAAHLQLFYEMMPKGKWRTRFFAGPSYFNVEQDLVHTVTVNETYPYDTATFATAVTGNAEGSSVGFNVGADISWMFSKRAGAGVLLRYAHAGIDLNAPDSRTVSTDGGGLQAGAGLRFLF
jgi:hypothetical protein